jgi:predicted PurR-regulated permease PerM
MSLTLNQFLFLVITIVVVVAITFLVTLIAQLRKTAKEGEKALKEIGELAKDFKETDKKIREKMDDLSGTLDAAKKSAVGISEIVGYMTAKVIQPSSKYWPMLLPLLRFGWRQIKKKKRKEEKNGK